MVLTELNGVKDSFNTLNILEKVFVVDVIVLAEFVIWKNGKHAGHRWFFYNKAAQK